MIGTCLTCGASGDLEAHHVAGRHNNRTLTVPVCLACHRILSAWQLGSGIELREYAERNELDATRALLVGAIHLLQLYGQRHADTTWLPAPLAVHTARAVSMLMDAMGHPDREGRWLPDPTAPPAEATPVAFPPATELDRVTEMAHLVRELAVILGDCPPLTLPTLIAIAARPADFHAAMQRIAGDAAAVTRLWLLLSDYRDRLDHLVRRLLTLPSTDAVNGDVIREGEAALTAGHQLLLEVLALAAPSAGAPPSGEGGETP